MLLDEQVDVYLLFDIETGGGDYIKESCWCQRKAMEQLPTRNWPTVKLLFNAMSDSKATMNQSLWNTLFHQVSGIRT